MKPRHFIDLADVSSDDVRLILDDARRRKTARVNKPQGYVDADSPAASHVLSMIFQKNSTRTRFSFDAAMRQLGGQSIISSASDMQLGRGEAIADTAKVLSRMVDIIMIRANDHNDVLDLANAATIPVINGLTDLSHPCQIIADILTLETHLGSIKGKTVAWVGDGNNVCTSLIHAATRCNFQLNIATPLLYRPKNAAMVFAKMNAAEITVFDDPKSAVAGADAVFTDTWVSMGDEDLDKRMFALGPYQVNSLLMAFAKPKAFFLHCLPAHRGEEVTSDVIDGPQSLVWEAAENRIHAQKSIIAWCLHKI